MIIEIDYSNNLACDQTVTQSKSCFCTLLQGSQTSLIRRRKKLHDYERTITNSINPKCATIWWKPINKLVNPSIALKLEPISTVWQHLSHKLTVLTVRCCTQPPPAGSHSLNEPYRDSKNYPHQSLGRLRKNKPSNGVLVNIAIEQGEISPQTHRFCQTRSLSI